MTVRFDYHTPQTWEEAVALLDHYGAEARPLAGGTDLLILMQRGLIAPRHIISLDRIAGWDALRTNEGITLGAGTTYRQIERLPVLYTRYTALVEAARQVGGVQIRNVATVAGNLCNASPAADSVPPLLVMDAMLTLHGPQGERLVRVDGFITGPRQTILQPCELLRHIHIPPLPERTATIFLKAGRRQAMEISIVSVAARLTLDVDGTIRTARLALGAVAPTPIRVVEAERLLVGEHLRPDLLAEVAASAQRAASPISDVRASAAYRLHLIGVMTQRALKQCAERIASAEGRSLPL